MDTPTTKFADSRGARIAYQDYGQDDPTVVAIPPMAQNLETAWEWPAVASMLERFGSFARWIQFDKRGTGASDRRSRMPGADERVEDLRAVMDAAGVESAYLYGASEGGPTCVLFAATYPERVDGLILHGTGPYTTPQGLSQAERDDYMAAVAAAADLWGTDESIWVDGFAPSLASDADFRAWHQRYERVSADRASLIELLEISLDIDVTELLVDIDTPTLVMHRVGDPILPVDWGRELADGIHGAEMIELEGTDHFGYAGERVWLDHLERFVTGRVRPASARVASSRTVSIKTMGSFTVEVDGVAVPQSEWGSRKARQLCKRLVAARGWPVRREELFEVLWPDETDTSRLGARLSVQLSHVRRVLGGGVNADRLTVSLDLDAVSSDLEHVLGDDDPGQIVAAYAGDFLPADVYDDWSTPVREQARRRFLAAGHELARDAIARGDNATVLSLVDRLLAADPHDEVAHRLAFDSCLQAGDRAAARRIRTRWHEAMVDLGLEAPTLDELTN